MPQFLISKKSIEADLAILNSQESHHLTRVLRKKAGDSITLSAGEGNQFEGEIFELEPVVKIKIRSVLKEEKNTRSIILCSAIIKGPRMDWVIEKATELGVTHLMPFVSERG